MKFFRKRSGFTLIELLVVILILAILMAIALPLYLRAVKDSERQTCRSNMQTIAIACQAYKVRNPAHLYPLTGPGVLDLAALPLPIPGDAELSVDLQAVPICPNHDTTVVGLSYSGTENTDGTITISCNCSDGAAATFHNALGTPNVDGGVGFTPGLDSR